MHVTLEGRSLLSLRAPQASTVRDLLDVVFEDVPTLRPTGTWARGRTLQPRAVYVWSLLDVRRIPPRLGRVVTPVLETIARSPWWAQVPDVVPDFVDLVLDNFDPDQGIEFYHSESGEAAAMLLWPVHDGETLDLGFSEP